MHKVFSLILFCYVFKISCTRLQVILDLGPYLKKTLSFHKNELKKNFFNSYLFIPVRCPAAATFWAFLKRLNTRTTSCATTRLKRLRRRTSTSTASTNRSTNAKQEDVDRKKWHITVCGQSNNLFLFIWIFKLYLKCEVLKKWISWNISVKLLGKSCKMPFSICQFKESN